MYRGSLTALVVYALVSGPVSGLVSAADVRATADLPDIGPCLAHLDPELDIGYDRIAARCPELVKQLDHGAWAPWLPRGWKESGNDLSAGGLKELRDLVGREDGAT